MSALHLVVMPKWGLSMEAGVVVGWHRPVGGVVAAGEDLVDVETTKITNSVEAPASGVLLRTLVATGETAACGAALAVIGPATATDAEIYGFVAASGAHAAETAGAAAVAAPEPVVATILHDGTPLRLRYLDTGAGAETLVLLHGFGGDLDNWMFNQPALAAGRRVIAIDLPGHGGSDKQVGDGSAGTLARAVAALLDDIAPGPVHLVGHSFGGVVVRALAQAAPARVASVTAIAPADLGIVSRAYIDGFIGSRRRSDLGAALALLFADPALVTRDMAEALLRYKRLDGVDAALRAIDAANFAMPGAAPEAVAFWQGRGARGLLIWGAEDAVVPLAEVAGALVVAGAGHMPHLEKADVVNAAIARHVAAHAAERGSAA